MMTCRTIRMDALRYEVVVKRCIELAVHLSSSNYHINAFLCHLDDFEKKFEGLTLDSKSGSTKVKENTIMDKSIKLLSPHVIKGKWRPQTKRKVPTVKKIAKNRKKIHLFIYFSINYMYSFLIYVYFCFKVYTCRNILDDESQFSYLSGSQLGASNEGFGPLVF